MSREATPPIPIKNNRARRSSSQANKNIFLNESSESIPFQAATDKVTKNFSTVHKQVPQFQMIRQVTTTQNVNSMIRHAVSVGMGVSAGTFIGNAASSLILGPKGSNFIQSCSIGLSEYLFCSKKNKENLNHSSSYFKFGSCDDDQLLPFGISYISFGLAIVVLLLPLLYLFRLKRRISDH